jgi:hypothetical protein
MDSARDLNSRLTSYQGNKFFFKTNGTQFYIKGIAYQSGIASAGAGSISDTVSSSDAYVHAIH